MFNTTESDRHVPVAPPRWSGERMLQIAHRLNDRCIALLARVAPTDIAQSEFSAVFASQALWARLDESACRRAAHCPVLLLDLNFRRREWWNGARQGLSSDLHAAKSGSLFVNETAAVLLREILIEARTFARTMPQAVGFAFGMAPEVGAVIAEMSITEIDRIASQQLRELQPRWKKCQRFWSRLLQAALDGNDEALTAVHLHAMQLLGGECLVDFVEPRASAAPRARAPEPSILPLAPIVLMNRPSKEPI